MDTASALALLAVVVAIVSLWRTAVARSQLQAALSRLNIEPGPSSTAAYQAEVTRLRVLLEDTEAQRNKLRQDLDVAMLRISQLEAQNSQLEARLQVLLRGVRGTIE
jgi:hypothetical protein